MASDLTVVVIGVCLTISAFGLAADVDDDGTPSYQEAADLTNPFLADTDLDGLNDPGEMVARTNPRQPDTDKDGLSDGLEVRAPRPIEDANPRHKDIYIEVDYTRQASIPEEQLSGIRKSFEEAPVDNPNGEDGFRIHYSINEEPVTSPSSEVTVDEYFDRYHNNGTVFSRNGQAYYHVLIVEDVNIEGFENNSAVVGATIRGEDGVLVEESQERNETGVTMMHEIGHALGLDEGDYRGIDSFSVSEEVYPSVMNYNYRRGCPTNETDGSCMPPFQFSSSDSSFNDWQHLEQEGIRGPSTNKIENGTALRGLLP